MKNITYIKGDLFSLLPKNDIVKVIPHVCNNKGGWGAGFVLSISQHWKLPEERYRLWHKKEVGVSHHGKFELGNIDECHIVDENVIVINMIAQDGYKSQSNTTPLKYTHLSKCLVDTEKQMTYNYEKNYEVHAPKFGAGLAGGDWNFIEKLVQEVFCEKDISVFIYSL